MLTAEDYMRLAERCAVLARECASKGLDTHNDEQAN